MSGSAIKVLRASKLSTVLTEAELHCLAHCSQFRQYSAGDRLLKDEDMDERILVLQDGWVKLYIQMMPHEGDCGGEGSIDIRVQGEPFGWMLWMREDRLNFEIEAMTPTSLLVIDLARLCDTPTFLKVSERMLQILWGRLQECGLCPANVQGLLKFQHVYSR